MQLAASRIADLVAADLVGPDVEITGIEFDSRQCGPGDLFLALRAERDGHDFIGAAVDNGAVAVMGAHTGGHDVALLRVDDAEAALRRLARARRDELAARGVPVVGVTGSVGKTSTKDLIAAAIGVDRPVHANPASFNNELGVPLTLARTPDDARVVVCEMGARGLGHISELAELVRPTIGVVTAVAAAHTSEFGSIDAIEQAKGELVEALPPAVDGGVAVLNGADDRVRRMASRTAATVRLVGGESAGVGITDVELDDALRARFTASVDGVEVPVTLAAAGAHMVPNAALALAVAVAVGVDPALAAEGLAGAGVSRWRMEVSSTAAGGTVINDAYNANPTSTRAALAALSALRVERRVAVLGTMAELGDDGDEEHRAVATEAVAAGIRVIAVAEPAYGDGATHVADLDAAAEAVGAVDDGTGVLVKGSRVAGLERLADRLLG